MTLSRSVILYRGNHKKINLETVYATGLICNPENVTKCYPENILRKKRFKFKVIVKIKQNNA